MWKCISCISVKIKSYFDLERNTQERNLIIWTFTKSTVNLQWFRDKFSAPSGHNLALFSFHQISWGTTEISLKITKMGQGTTEISLNSTKISWGTTEISLKSTQISWGTAEISLNSIKISWGTTEIILKSTKISWATTEISLNSTKGSWGSRRTTFCLILCVQIYWRYKMALKNLVATLIFYTSI